MLLGQRPGLGLLGQGGACAPHTMHVQQAAAYVVLQACFLLAPAVAHCAGQHRRLFGGEACALAC
jgi:hypothetical protein